MPLLPQQVRKQGVNIKKKSPDILLAVSFISPDGRYDEVYLSNYATLQVKDELLRLYGVGDVVYLGQRDYSMRAWLDPEQLATRGLTAEEVVQAVAHQNQQVVCGCVGQQPSPRGQQVQVTLSAPGRLTTPEEFGNLIVKTGSVPAQGPDTAVLIPLIAVPVAIVGTFAAMAAFGFSLNTLSLFGLVLAIGIVVDDAIVVVENVERWLARGLPPRDAAVKAMAEVTGPVIGVTLVLSAVFIPCAFISGIVGQFFRQFALTIAVSTLISAFNSLTLSPALAALLLKPHGARRDPLTWLLDVTLGWFFRLFNWGFNRCTNIYVRLVGLLLRGSAIGLVVYGGLLVLTYLGFKSSPVGFIPIQDQGYLVLMAQLPDSASVQRTKEVMDRLDCLARSIPGVKHTLANSGQSFMYMANSPNWGSMFVVLDDFDKRREPRLKADAILAKLQEACDREIQEAVIGVYPAPPVNGLGNGGGLKLYVEDRGNLGLDALQEYTDTLISDAEGPQLLSVRTSFRARTSQLFLDIDRSKARSLGVDVKGVFSTLQIYMGGIYVNPFNDFGRTWQVNAMADPSYRTRIDDVLQLQVRNIRGEMLPLASLVTVRPVGGPVMVCRYNLFEAAPVISVPAPGTPGVQVITRFRDLAARDLPEAMTTEWSEFVYLQITAGNTAMLLFGLGVVLVFLVLAALYEGWSLPLAVILVVPMCLLCSVAGLMVAHLPIDILAQVGLVVLVGLASKNAILIVEFAKQQRDGGVEPRLATLEACRLRLRPILMTSFAFILGVVPLIVATGAGAEMRHSLGTTVFSGMLGVTLFGIFLTPVFFYVIARLTGGPSVSRARLRKVGQVALAGAAFVVFGYLGVELGLHLFGEAALRSKAHVLDELADLVVTLPIVGKNLAAGLREVHPRLLAAFGICGALGVVALRLLTFLAPLVRGRMTVPGSPAASPRAASRTPEEGHS
jgi:multidrug efflux pump